VIKVIFRIASTNLLAQFLSIMAMPVILIFYSPNDFLLFGVFISLFNIFNSFTHLRYNVAINVAKSISDAFSLYYLSILCSIFINFIIMIPLILSRDLISKVYQIEISATTLLLLPLAVIFASIYSANNYLWTRLGKFKTLQKAILKRAILSVTTQIIFGISGLTYVGLLMAHIMQNLPSAPSRNMRLSTALKYGFCKKDRYRNMLKVAWKYNRYPKYSTLENLTSTLGANLPVLIVAAYVDVTTAGVLYFAIRILSIPVSLLGRYISQVNIAFSHKVKNRNEFYEQNLKLFFLLVIIIIVLYAIIYQVSFLTVPDALRKWESLPIIIKTLSPWFLVQLVVSPLSSILHVTGELKKSMFINLSGILLRVVVLQFLLVLKVGDTVQNLVITSVIFYFIYGIILFISLRNWKNNIGPNLT
jgi:O-antigen/teichoic acid export membrane protein